MASVLSTLSNEMGNLVENSSKSIVRVEARHRMPASGIIYSADGVIVTSNHGVEIEEGIRIGLPNGETVNAKLIGRDPGTDLAILRAEASGLTPADWVDAGDLHVGNLILALGRPGRTVQASLGVVSALGSAWSAGGGSEIDRYLQTDVVMYPGFSGGPLVEAGGKFAGLNTSAMNRGASLTIPSATIKRVVEQILAHGSVQRGYLGVGIQPVRLPDAVQQSVGQETGLIVMSVEADGPAGKAGIAQGDVLVTLAGDPIRHLDDLQAALRSDRVGKSVVARIVRAGSVQNVDVVVAGK